MAKLVVIGALALDRPIRLSGPPAPGARLTGQSLKGALAGRLGGGGANSAVALVRAGHQVRLAAIVAEDEDGRHAIALAQAAGLDTELVEHRPGVSRRTLILVDPAGERLVLSLDPGPFILPSLSPPPDEPCEGLYVRAPYGGAAAWAETCQGPIVAHWPCPGFAGPCDALVASADDCDADTLADPFAAGRTQVGDRLCAFVLTHGPNAIVAYRSDGQVRFAPKPATVRDATGAGDVFAAGLLDALVAGAELEPALAHACAWGAVAVGLNSSAPTEGFFTAFRPGGP